MNPEELATRSLVGLGAAALALVPDFVGAIKEGDRRLARDIAEEMTRREAFEALQRAKAPKKP